MGCDIHGWVETKVGNKWVAVEQLHGRARYRNYARFAALAGVRGDGPKPRGVPSDVSDTAKWDIESWEGDGHSHSFAPLKDAIDIFLETEYEQMPGWVAKYPWEYYFDFPYSGDDLLSDFRLVFWFDN